MEETYGNKVNGTYIYRVDLTNLETQVTTRSTLTLKMLLAPTKKTEGININMPIDAWYQLNKDKIPFYAPPTTTLSDNTNLAN